MATFVARQGDRLAPPVFVAASDPGGFHNGQAGPYPARKSQLRIPAEGRPAGHVPHDYELAADGMRAVRTSSCPLLAPQSGEKSFSGIEHWPHPVMMLAIADIRILPKGAPYACE